MATKMAGERDIEVTEQQSADIRDYQLPQPDMGVHLYPKGQVLYLIIIAMVEDTDAPPARSEIPAGLP